MNEPAEVVVRVSRSAAGRLQAQVLLGEQRDLGLVLLEELPILLEALYEELS